MRLALVIALIAVPTLAIAQDAGWPTLLNDAAYAHAKADALKRQPSCIDELKGGADGDACQMYRLSASRVFDILTMRNEWCIKRIDDRSRPTPAQCLAPKEEARAEAVLTEIGWDPVEAILQAQSPERKAAVAAAIAQIAN